MAISITMVAFNCNYLDYCLEAAIRSGLTFADEVIVNEGMSFDDTHDTLIQLQEEFGKDVIKIFRREWKHDRGWQERERNFAIDKAKGDWIVIQDADDCFHEKDANLIKKVAADPSVNLINFEVLHFYGLPCFTNPNPDWYHRHTRMGRKKVDFRIRNTPGGCVSDVTARGKACHGYRGPDIVWLAADHPIYHYGWVRDARVAGIKLNKFRGWYNDDEKYYDGKLDENVPFDYRLLKHMKKLHKFKSTHPTPAYKWFISRNRLIKYDPAIHGPYYYSPEIPGNERGFGDSYAGKPLTVDSVRENVEDDNRTHGVVE
jgi:glycosyltransferase involved in cell wall biosynthesis